MAVHKAGVGREWRGWAGRCTEQAGGAVGRALGREHWIPASAVSRAGVALSPSRPASVSRVGLRPHSRPHLSCCPARPSVPRESLPSGRRVPPSRRDLLPLQGTLSGSPAKGRNWPFPYSGSNWLKGAGPGVPPKEVPQEQVEPCPGPCLEPNNLGTRDALCPAALEAGAAAVPTAQRRKLCPGEAGPPHVLL